MFTFPCPRPSAPARHRTSHATDGKQPCSGEAGGSNNNGNNGTDDRNKEVGSGSGSLHAGS
jgi:hypothetical protein